MNQNIYNIKKQILYRCTYTGKKETDLLYRRIIINKLNSFTYIELIKLSELFIKYSDIEIFDILVGKSKFPKKFKIIFSKLLND